MNVDQLVATRLVNNHDRLHLYYWPDKPCSRGHLTWRYRSNSECRECHKILRQKRNNHGPNVYKRIRDLQDELIGESI